MGKKARVNRTQKVDKPFTQALQEINRAGTLDSTTMGFLEDLDKLMRPNPVGLKMGMLYGRQSKYVSVTFDPEKYKTIELLHVTDVQFGHAFCNIKRMEEYRDWVLKKKNRFMVWGGDMIDAHAAWSPGQPWENLFDPQSQVYRFVELWAPARHRVLGYVGGNHERRALPAFGDLGILIASMLRIPYSSGKQHIDINFGAWKPFKVNLWHGRGASRTAGAKMNMLCTFMRQGDGNLYLVGHLHDPMTKFMWRELRNTKSLKVDIVKVGGAMSSSFLETYGTYGEVAGFDCTDVMMARAVIEPNGHWELTLRTVIWGLLSLGLASRWAQQVMTLWT